MVCIRLSLKGFREANPGAGRRRDRSGRAVLNDPRDGSEGTELGLPDFLRQHWGMPASYVIAAYNDIAKIPDPAVGTALVIGIEAFIPQRAELAAGYCANRSSAAGAPHRALTRDKPVPMPVRGSLFHADPGSRLLAV
jgi:hypothetical protein